MPVRNITVLGSTGSIGTNTLDVVRQNRDQFQVFALAAGRNVYRLAEQIVEFEPRIAVLQNSEDLPALRALLPAGLKTEFRSGKTALVEISVAPEVDTVMSSIVGVAGLPATYAAIQAGKRIGLANKEVLVSAGELVMAAVKRHGVELIPVDSEHNGAHQALRAGRRSEVTKLILTASGGPFRTASVQDLDSVRPADALKHPTWNMGNRITIDSATLMNKGFEVIEACWLFDFAPDQVEVVVHPQSTVHAMVEYNDGSVLAQISATDMRMPIQYALTWPDRWQAPVPKIDWGIARQWEFHAPDTKKFPALRIAYDALRAGGASTCILNAADEVAVSAFLEERISFPAIARVVEETLSRIPLSKPMGIEEVLAADREGRKVAAEVIASGKTAISARSVTQPLLAAL